MKIKDAISRIRFTIGNKNRPNEKDADAFNSILLHFKNSEEKTIQDNLLFAKLYCFILEKNVMNYKNADFANEQINKVLSQPLKIRIESLKVSLKNMELSNYFEGKGVKDYNLNKANENAETLKFNMAEFMELYDVWDDDDNIKALLNRNINSSIQKYKNYV